MTKEMIVIKYSPKMIRNMKAFKELLARFEEVEVMSYNLCFSFHDDSEITPHDIELVKHCGCKTMGILGDDVYMVEVNSRITTPYVALRQMLNFNLGKAILESVNGYLPQEVKLEGEIEFHKNESLQLKVIN